MPGVQNPHCRPCSCQNALLERVELAVGGQPLDRTDLGAVDLGGQHGATLDRDPIEGDDARSALAGVATHLGARQFESFPQQIHQKHLRLCLKGVLLPVYRKRYLHVVFLPRCEAPTKDGRAVRQRILGNATRDGGRELVIRSLCSRLRNPPRPDRIGPSPCRYARVLQIVAADSTSGAVARAPMSATSKPSCRSRSATWTFASGRRPR